MANVRSKIEMTAGEQLAFIESSKTVIMGTINHDGYPHLVPMWFNLVDGLVHMHTYRTSQKAVNLQRNPKGSLLVEDGVEYDKLRGVFMRGRFDVIDDQELCFRIAVASAKKYQGIDAGEAEEPGLRHYVRKRVAMVFHPEKISSWDHRKIGAAA